MKNVPISREEKRNGNAMYNQYQNIHGVAINKVIDCSMSNINKWVQKITKKKFITFLCTMNNINLMNF